MLRNTPRSVKKKRENPSSWKTSYTLACISWSTTSPAFERRVLMRETRPPTPVLPMKLIPRMSRISRVKPASMTIVTFCWK